MKDDTRETAPQKLLEDFARKLRELADRSGTDICAMAAVISQTADNAGTVDTLMDDRFSKEEVTQLLAGLLADYVLANGMPSEQTDALMQIALAQAAAALAGPRNT